MSVECGPTLSVARGATRVHQDLVDSLDGEDTLEVGVNVRENGHDCSPNQSTVIVLLGLYERIQSCNRGESRDYSRRTGRLKCIYGAVLSLGFLGIRSMGLPSGEHLVLS